MKKTILITGSTDGIGLKAAEMMVQKGHHVLLHGRSSSKMEAAEKYILSESKGQTTGYVYDLSDISEVEKFAEDVVQNHDKIDVLINNAGIYVTQNPHKDGLDIRFVVNTIAPYLLTKRLLPLLGDTGRVVNLSSAAQAPLTPDELKKESLLSDGMVYARSKLAITMWSFHMAIVYKDKGPLFVAVNPASMLGSKMVKEAYGVSGNDLGIGADILYRASLSDEFKDANGKYFDNDIGKFSMPYPDGTDFNKCKEIVRVMEEIIKERVQGA